jgi:prepilin-type N-terminal cleavage/methylation domain-containing protein
MKTNHPHRARRRHAFTLVELLVVMAVIATLAAILFPAFSAFKKNAAKKKARAEMVKVIMAIESYKAQMGHYPPDHVITTGVDPLVNSLYFELSGTTNTGSDFVTLDGAARILVGSVAGTFGRDGFVNCSKGGGDDNAQPAHDFLKGGLRLSNYGDTPPPANLRLLTCSIKWPEANGSAIPGVPLLNPWRYVSTGPTNNPGHYDLWVDIVVGGQTNRISNWNERAQLVAY